MNQTLGFKISDLVVDIPTNELAVKLSGEYDQNLQQIENALGVEILARGNLLSITGSSAARARDVILELIKILKKGSKIDSGEIDGVIRLVLTRSLESTRLDFKTPKKRILTRSARQTDYIKSLTNGQLTFGVGPAGTGKTYLAVAVAASMLSSGEVNRIVLSRPAVEAGERLGFLPGDLKEKIDPYLRPLYDALRDVMDYAKIGRAIENGTIEIAPLAFMRGRTIEDSFVILDEAQNTTNMQMKMFLTRLGERSRMVVTGDLTQIDLPKGIDSGLIQALKIVKKIKKVDIIKFDDSDIVRHPLVAEIVKGYDSL